MHLNTVIFDMDGLLIDSEPLWKEAADEVFRNYDIQISTHQYNTTTGMRTKEFVTWWFRHFNRPLSEAPAAEKSINNVVIEIVQRKGKAMPGLEHIINFFAERNYKMGLASSSGMDLIEVVVDKLGLRPHLQSLCSAALLEYGKPHPQVYLNCAAALNSDPLQCICFEDSFNGLIAAKAARMKCIVIPALHDSKDARFNAADLKLSSLQNFNELLLQAL